MNLVSSTGLNNEAITFNGRTPSFHRMALMISTKYATTTAVYIVFTLGTFIILKLLAAASLGLVVRLSFIGAPARNWKNAEAENVASQTSTPFKTCDDASGNTSRATNTSSVGLLEAAAWSRRAHVCSSFVTISDDRVNNPIFVKSQI